MTQLSTNQVALRYGFSTSTLRRWRQRGVGPRYTAIKRGPYHKTHLYKLDDLLAWEREFDIKPVRDTPPTDQ